jgi:ATP-dependent helicase/nuclease subunit A
MEGMDAVRLMTIHAAKGLEFGVVALADLGRQGRIDVPDLLVDGPRVGLRLAALDGSAPVPALEYDALKAERQAAEAREEERVLYVAMTRARERLLLSGAVNLERWPVVRPGAPALSWLGPAVAEDLLTTLTTEDPAVELSPPGDGGARVRGWLNSPATVGRVLREESLTARATPSAGPGEATPPAPPAADRRPPALGVVPTLSYTALAEHERCGYRYYLERVLGLAPDESGAPAGDDAPAAPGGLSGRLRGSLVHRLLESIDYAHPRPPSPEEVAGVAAELGARPSEAESRAIGTLVSAVAETELGGRLASAARILREHPFAFALGPGEPLISGVLDAIAHELDGGCLVVDYKSDAVGGADLELLTERHYGIQRAVYALAALRGGALEVEVVHWFLQRPREPVSARFAAADASALAAVLSERAAAVAAGRFAVTAHPHRELCLTCPGRRSLCSYPEEVTLRPAP